MSEFEDNDNNQDQDFDLPPDPLLAAPPVQYDLSFQQSCIHLALIDDHFCTQMVKYLGNSKELKEFNIFEHEDLNVLFKMIVESFKQYQKKPSESQLRQKIMEKREEERRSLTHALNAVYKSDISDEKYYRDNLTGFIKQGIFLKAYFKMKDVWVKKDSDQAYKTFQGMLDKLNAVSFEKDSVFKLDDFAMNYEKTKNSTSNRVPTGIHKLDKDLLGGFPRQGLVVVLSGTNVGKSMFCISLGSQALKSKDAGGVSRDFKVLHVNLEGNAVSTLFRYYANLAQIPYNNIAQGLLTDEEQARLKRVEEQYKSRFMLKNFAGTFGVTIESLEAWCKETYKTFKFDVLIVDYGQLLETQRETEGYRHIMTTVFRGLDTMSKAFDCCVISPAQATRAAQGKQNPFGNQFAKFQQPTKSDLPVMRSEDISEAFEIARVAEIILSLNASDEEKVQNRLRLFLEKQRDGAKNQTYGLHTRFDMCDLITGNFYDPKATITKENEAPEQVETMDFFGDKKEKKSASGGSSEEQMDELVVNFKSLSKKEDNLKADYNIELKRPEAERSEDVLSQFKQDIEKIKKNKVEIITLAQGLIKIIDPKASEELLKEMEKSYSDLQKSEATADQIQNHLTILERYRLGLKGKV